MAYTHTTLNELVNQLAVRLGDSTKTFWGTSEMKEYIIESCRVWNTLTGFWKKRVHVTSVAGQAFYDLSAEVDPERTYNLTDRDLVIQLQYHLMETVTDGSTWTGTPQFSLSMIADSATRIRNLILATTSLVVTHDTIAVTGPPTAPVTLDDDVMQVRRFLWKDFDGRYYMMTGSSEASATFKDPNWVQRSGIPRGWSALGREPLLLRLVPSAKDVGTLDGIFVKAPPDLDPTSQVNLGMPDDLIWLLKWGVLEDILAQDGQSVDMGRSIYAGEIFKLGLSMLEAFPSVVHAEINGRPVIPSSLASLDRNYRSWQSISGTPKRLAFAGQNLFALSPVPSTNTTSVTLDVVENCPLTSTTVNIPIGREHLDTILQFAHHLAYFKVGGMEFERTKIFMKNMMTRAQEHNMRLLAVSPYLQTMLGVGDREKQTRPNQRARTDWRTKLSNERRAE